jgi:ribosomal protein L11 methyltransferase
VPEARAEQARATMLELFPGGFEEVERKGVLELAAYTDSAGATGMWRAFGEYAWSEVPEDWQDRWREFHRAVEVAGLWVGPPWLEAPADKIAVVIDPGRAFGTGAHPTTQACLELLSEAAASGGSVLDVGCGSGVLSIAAVKLGFAPVIAFDHDEVTVETARRNARVNGVDIEVRLLEALEDELPAVDVAVANISAGLVEAIAPRLDAAALITSGYLEPDRPEVSGFAHRERRARDGWAADLWAPA